MLRMIFSSFPGEAFPRPGNVIYRALYSKVYFFMSLDKVSTFGDEIFFFFQTLYLEDGTMLPDPSSTSRPPRPNSIEVKRNYPPGSSGAYPNNEESAYGTRHSRSPQDGMYRLVIRFFWKIRTS